MPSDPHTIGILIVSLLGLLCLMVLVVLIVAGRKEKEEPMEIVLTDNQIAKAVEWWMDALRKPEFRTTTDEDRRTGREIHGQVAEGMAAKLHVQVEDDKILAFGVALESRIREALSDPRKTLVAGEVVLAVDYGPNQLLCDALEAAGIKPGMSVLPWKTTMYVGTKNVRVKYGYGQPYNVIA